MEASGEMSRYLRSAFLADLLGRFTALYSRVGSPDFSKTAVNRISGEIG